MKVQVLPAARNDILRKIEFYQDEAGSAQRAERFLIALEAAFEQLCKMPHMGAPRDFNHPELTGLRAWPVPEFSGIRVYYIPRKDEVRVVRVLHGKRDLGMMI